MLQLKMSCLFFQRTLQYMHFKYLCLQDEPNLCKILRFSSFVGVQLLVY